VYLLPAKVNIDFGERAFLLRAMAFDRRKLIFGEAAGAKDGFKAGLLANLKAVLLAPITFFCTCGRAGL
jgi:hypothetical protein